MFKGQVLEDTIFKVGRVISVNGRSIRIRVDKAKNTSHLMYKGELVKNVTVGGYLKIVKGFTNIIGKVEGEFTVEDRTYEKREYKSRKEKINRELQVSLLGFFADSVFYRGIKELPLIDNECFLLNREEFESVHDFVSPNDIPITIGTLSLEKAQPIRLGVESLFTSHIGIFGNTGSGKSYTLAKLYGTLLEQFKTSSNFQKNAAFFLLDFNGEYIGADVIVDAQWKKTYRLDTRNDTGDKYPVGIETLDDPAFWAIFLTATEKTQAPFLSRALKGQRFSDKFETQQSIKELIVKTLTDLLSSEGNFIERTLIFRFLRELKLTFGSKITGINALLANYSQSLQWHSGQKKYFYRVAGSVDLYSDHPNFVNNVILQRVNPLQVQADQLTDIDRIRLKIVFQYFFELVQGHSSAEHLGPLIGRLDRRFIELNRVMEVEAEQDQTESNARNFTIVSLKDVNLSMKKVLPLLICKQLYDRKKEQNEKNKFLNLIIDEAHNILSFASERESETWKDYRLETFEEIIKEGRKFGVFLTIASQRPYDISATIISQLHNYFLHRLINNNDILAVERTISYLDKISVEYLSILPRGTCILAGLVTQVPVVIDIAPILPKKHEPDNKTMALVKNWIDPRND